MSLKREVTIASMDDFPRDSEEKLMRLADSAEPNSPDPFRSRSSSSNASSASVTDLSSSRHTSPWLKYNGASPLRLPADLALCPSIMSYRGYDNPHPSNASTSSMSSYAPSDFEDDDAIREPPNFAEVEHGLYRSGFPREQHFNHVRLLNLRSVLCLTPDPYPPQSRAFLAEENIEFFQIGMPGNKEETIKVSPESIQDALKIVLDPSRYPLLIHCNKGKHRTGCVVGCLRKIQRRDIEDVVQEYRKYSYPKSRPMDEQCIKHFDVAPVWQDVKKRMLPNWLSDYDAVVEVKEVSTIDSQSVCNSKQQCIAYVE